jgi:hypothetical protein
MTQVRLGFQALKNLLSAVRRIPQSLACPTFGSRYRDYRNTVRRRRRQVVMVIDSEALASKVRRDLMLNETWTLLIDMSTVRKFQKKMSNRHIVLCCVFKLTSLSACKNRKDGEQRLE